MQIKPDKNFSLENIKGEVWKDIKNWEGYYQVSNYGRVKSLFRIVKQGNRDLKVKEKIRKLVLNKLGYYDIFLKKVDFCKVYKVHRLVAQAFIPNLENKPEVNHINEIKTDNRVKNLNWMTSKENMNWGSVGKKISKSMINGKNSKKVYQYDLEGNFIKEWPSCREAERFGFTNNGVSMCARGITNSHKEFKWSYKKLH